VGVGVEEGRLSDKRLQKTYYKVDVLNAGDQEVNKARFAQAVGGKRETIRAQSVV
jgi:hypothetical protein